MHTLKHSTHNIGQTFGTYNISQVYINTNLQRKIAQKNRLIETILLSTHNICFGWKIRKVFFFGYTLLTKGLTYVVSEGSDKPAHVRSLATAFSNLRLTFYLSYVLHKVNSVSPNSIFDSD